MGYRLSVDLGTTYTAAAVDDGSGPTMVGLGNRALQVPSVLFVQPDGTFLHGEAAERRGLTDPARVVREFKRRIGDTVPILVGGSPHSPESLTSRLLAWVVGTATERQGGVPQEVVLTFPANWGVYKRELFGRVASSADVPGALLCTEPQAAALRHAARVPLAQGGRLAVYDLGGGTFDTCVLQRTGDGFEILGTPAGLEHLGGIDFDEAVFRHVLGALEPAASRLDPEDPAIVTSLARLRRDCADAKEALSTDVDVAIPVNLPGMPASVRLTRPELEELITPALAETLAAMRRSLRSAQTAPEDLEAVVLVGGSSRIPVVSHLLQEELGVTLALDTHPKHDIALGALLYRPHVQPAGRVADPDGRPTELPLASSPERTARADGEPSRPQEVTAWPSRQAAVADQAAAPPATVSMRKAGDGALPGTPPGSPAPLIPTTEGAGGDAPSPAAGSPALGPETPSRGRWRRLVLVALVAAGVIGIVGVAAAALLGEDPRPPSSSPPAEVALASPQEIVVALEREGGRTAMYRKAPGGDAEPLAELPGNLTFPSLSPDRTTVVFAGGEADSSLEVVTASGQRPFLSDSARAAKCRGRPAWLSDDEVLLLCLDQAGKLGVFSADLDADGVATLGRQVARSPLDGAALSDLAVSLDGSRLTMTVLDVPDPDQGIWMFDLGLRIWTHLVGGRTADADWSPVDLGRLAFRGVGGDLYLADLSLPGVPEPTFVCPDDRVTEDPTLDAEAGTTFCRLTATADSYEGGPSWNTDGTALAFKRGVQGSTVEVIDLLGDGDLSPEPLWPDAPGALVALAWTSR